MKRSNRQGIALLVVIPIVLLTFLLGLVFLEMVTTRAEIQADAMGELRAKYGAIAAAQLALLEVSECGSLAANIHANDNEIPVTLFRSVPSFGQMAVGGNATLQWYSYQKNGNDSLTVDNGFPQKEPLGSALYLARDIDGDGKIGSIQNVTLGTVTLNAEISQTGTLDNPVRIVSNASSGSAYHSLKTVAYFP